MIAKDIMSAPAISIAPEASIQEVARTMRDHVISGVPVTDTAGKLLGVVTELALITRNAPLFSPTYIPLLTGLIPTQVDSYRKYREQLQRVLATTARQLMTDAEPIGESESLEGILTRMSKPEITMLPVVTNGKVVGVVTRTDLVRLIEELESSDA